MNNILVVYDRIKVSIYVQSYAIRNVNNIVIVVIIGHVVDDLSIQAEVMGTNVANSVEVENFSMDVVKNM